MIEITDKNINLLSSPRLREQLILRINAIASLQRQIGFLTSAIAFLVKKNGDEITIPLAEAIAVLNNANLNMATVPDVARPGQLKAIIFSVDEKGEPNGDKADQLRGADQVDGGSPQGDGDPSGHERGEANGVPPRGNGDQGPTPVSDGSPIPSDLRSGDGDLGQADRQVAERESEREAIRREGRAGFSKSS